MIRSILLLLALAGLLLAPAGASIAPEATAAGGRHWALAGGDRDLRSALEPLHGDAVCMLGDVDADGASDVLVRVRGEADARLLAVSGSGSGELLWELALEPEATLRCAPDAAGDGLSDPLVTLEKAASGVASGDGPVSNEEVVARLQALDGASGKALLALEGTASATSGSAGSVSGGATTRLTLDPGAEGLYLFVERERRGAMTTLLDELALSSDRSRATIRIVDAAGEVQGVVETPPQAHVLGFSIVSDAEAALLLLTATDASPIDQAPARVPTISSFRADGSQRWSVDLEATTQDLMLVPRAGDVDADGVEDLIVQTAPRGLGLPAEPRVAVVSGADGALLLERAADEGLLAALPLGDLTPDVAGDADALLVVAQAAADAPLVLECLREGATCWTAELPADAVPVNALTDRFTGDLAGFHDLTGDGLPDVATLARGEAGATLSVASGVDGAVAWSRAVAAEAQVRAVSGAEGADLAVLEPIDAQMRELVVSRLDGAEGELVWTARGQLPASIEDTHAHLAAHEDVALLLTVGDGLVYALDAGTGETLWKGAATVGGDEPPALEVTGAGATPRGVAALPAPPVALVAAVAVGVAVALGRRR